MDADIRYDDDFYDSRHRPGKLVVWDGDAMQWREPTEGERQAALEKIVLDLHRQLRNIKNG